MKQSQDKVFKIILCGAQGVGKTSILTRYIEGDYRDEYFSTIGIDFKLHSITFGSTKIKFQIWDTAGQQRFQSLTTMHFKGANACLCVADISNKQSLQSCIFYINSAIQQFGIDKKAIYLVANKQDIQDEDKILKKQLQQLSNEYGISFAVCSAKNGNGINKLFEDLAAILMLNSQQQGIVQQSINPRLSFKQKQNKCNC